MKNFSKNKTYIIYFTLIILTVIICWVTLFFYKQKTSTYNIYFLLTSKVNWIYTSSVYKIDSIDKEIDKSNIDNQKIVTADKWKIYQDFCKYKNHTFLVWWEFWDRDKSWIMSEIAFDKNIYKLSNITSSYEKRIRDCSVWKINNENYIWLVSHWKWYTFLYNISKNKTFKIPTTFYWENNKKNTLIHHIEFTDLDWDWSDEIYVTPTSEATRTTSWFQLWKILQIKIDNNYNIITKNISTLENGYAKRVKTIDIWWKKKLLVLYQSNIKPNWEIKTPTTLSEYSYSSWELVRNDLYSFWTDICFRIEAFKVSQGNTFQVWCGNWTLYLFKYNPKVELLKKYVLNDWIEENYWFDSVENAWNKIYIRSIFWKDIDNDWFDELFVWVSNVWLYYIDYKNNKLKKIVNLGLNDYNRWDNIIFWITDSLEKNNNLLPLNKF